MHIKKYMINILFVCQNDLIKELAGDFSAVHCAKLQCQDIPHGLFYLSVGSDMSENVCISFNTLNFDSSFYFKCK